MKGIERIYNEIKDIHENLLGDPNHAEGKVVEVYDGLKNLLCYIEGLMEGKDADRT